MIVAIMGFAGTGKSMLSVYLAARFKIFGNYEIISNMKEFKLRDYDLETDFIPIVDSIRADRNIIKQPKQRLLHVDEIQQYLDSRESSTKKNKKLSKYFYQIRKFGFDFIYTLQDFYSLDIRLRRITEMFMIPNYNKMTKILSYDAYSTFGQYYGQYTVAISDKILNLYDTFEDIDNSVILL